MEEMKKKLPRRQIGSEIDRYIEQILQGEEHLSLEEIAKRALNIMSRGYEYRGKHPITEAFEKICSMK